MFSGSGFAVRRLDLPAQRRSGRTYLSRGKPAPTVRPSPSPSAATGGQLAPPRSYRLHVSGFRSRVSGFRFRILLHRQMLLEPCDHALAHFREVLMAGVLPNDTAEVLRFAVEPVDLPD